MSVAIDLFGAVYTTQGGTRYHANPACYALANGRAYHAWRAGRTDAVSRGTGLYDVQRRSTISAAQFSYTACLACVPAANALPALPFVTGQTYGHEPVRDIGGQTVCRRCTISVAYWTGAEGENDGWEAHPTPVTWPCTSAVVLGLVPRGGA